MVYYDPTNLGWKPYVKSWMQRVGEKFKAETQVTIRERSYCLSIITILKRILRTCTNQHLLLTGLERNFKQAVRSK